MQRYSSSVQDKNGRAIVTASVRVLTSTGSLATIYSDNGVSTRANPISVDGTGEYWFYAANGRYTVEISAAGFGTESTEILLYDPLARVSIADYGASPSASASTNTIAIAAAHAAALTVDYPPGTYAFLGGVTLRSGTRICAAGATLRADPSFGASTAFFQNANQSAYTDTDICIEGLTLDGNGIGQGGASRTRTIGMVRFVKVTGLQLINCTFKNTGYIGATLRSCIRVRVHGCEFTGLGWDTKTSGDGGSALWCSSTAAGEDPQDIEIIGCHFHDNNWSGIQLNGIGALVSGCTFKNEYETHIYTPVDAELGKFNARQHAIVNNVFDTATYTIVSGNGIETCAWDSVIAGNVIRNCDERGIQVFASQNLVIADNVIGNCGIRVAGSARGAIGLISNNGALGTPGNSPTFRDNCRNVSIKGNRIYDNQGSPTTQYGVEAVGAYNNKAAANCSISGNDFTNVSWASAGSALSLGATAWDATTCTVGDNEGAASRTWTPTVTPGTGAINTYSVSQASYQKVGNLVHFTATVTITDNGTGGSNLKLTLPPWVPTLPFVVSGWNSTAARGVTGVWSSGTTISFFRPDTGAYPVTTGDTVRFSGSYLVA